MIFDPSICFNSYTNQSKYFLRFDIEINVSIPGVSAEKNQQNHNILLENQTGKSTIKDVPSPSFDSTFNVPAWDLTVS